MKSFLPIRSAILLTICFIFSFKGIAQALDGGSVAISTPCYSLTAPAPLVNSVTPASGGTAPYAYQWEAKINPSQWVIVNGATSATLSPGVLFNPTSYRRRVTDGTGAVSHSNTVEFQVSDNIKGGSVFLPGGLTTILVNTAPALIMSGTPAYDGSGSYTYTWETATNASGPWSNTGISTLNYQPPVITTLGTTCYRRKAVDNNCGGIGYTNIIQIITVSTLPFNQAGFTVGFSCVFPGYQPTPLTGILPYGGTAPYSYQWETRVGSGAWTEIPGATNISYQPPVLTQTTQFRRKASDAAGASAYSDEQTITYSVGDALPGSIAPNSTILIAPNALSTAVVNVTSASNFNNGNYFWETSTDNGSSWTSIPNYNHSSYYTDSAPAIRTCYRRGIHNVCASDDRIALTSYVCINPPLPLDPGVIASSSSNCITIGTSPGAITGTAAIGGSSPYAYQWQKNDNGNWDNINGANTVNYTPGAISHNTIYRRQVTDGSNMVLYTNEVSINLQSSIALKGGIVDGPIITCSGTAPGIINNIIDACGGGGTLQYTWEAISGSSSWTAITNTNGPTHNATAISASTKYRRKVGDGCGNAAYSNEVEVFVYPAIEAGTIFPVSQTVCSNSSTAEVLSLMQNCHYTNGNVSYQWQKSTSLSGPWVDIAGTNGTQTFYQPRAQAMYYRLKVSSSVCGAVAYSNIATINIIACVTTGKSQPTSNYLAPSTLSTKGNMKIYPNPAIQGQSVMVSVDGGEGNYKAILRSTDGRAYNCTVTSSAKGQLQVKLPQPMAKGTYLIQVSNNQKQWIERIVVQ